MVMKFKAKSDYMCKCDMYYVARKNNIKYTIENSSNGFYVIAEKLKENGIYNSMANNLYFVTVEEAQEWCIKNAI
jgi:sulfur transfer complex TusBCD TusB component (DsrH family)